MAESAPSPAQPDPFDALRERGVQRLAPVRLRFAEALARRAAAHAGAARQVLDARLATLLGALDALVAGSPDGAQVGAGPRPSRGALGTLVDDAARRKSTPLLGGPTSLHEAAPARPGPGPVADAKTLQFFKRTWSRLSADQRLAQSLASLPGNAGPLNSHHLVHRSLMLMRELSPEYLERFVGYVDALQWLEQADAAAAQEGGGTVRAAPARRSLPARRG
jgi:hypothetical protein